MRQRINKEGAILLGCAVPVLVQYTFKSGEERAVGMLAMAGLVYGIVAMVRWLFWLARRS